MPRIRLDKLLVKMKIAESEDEAVSLIESGSILVNGSLQKSPSSAVDSGSAVTFVKSKPKYVSRAGFKLEAALENFQLDPKDKRCLDIGTSTGGFTDCFLQHGAKEVVSVDVGHGQIDDSLRQNSHVKLFEKTNAKNIDQTLVGGLCQLGAVDVSFTSVIPLLPSIFSCLSPKELVVLIKPQFELPPKYINIKGIVQEASSHRVCIETFLQELPGEIVACELIPSPIIGTQGNLEFLCLLKEKSLPSSKVSGSKIKEVVEQAHEMRKIL